MATRVVALTFHDVTLDPGTSTVQGEQFYRVTLAELEQLLIQLRKRGYQSVSSREFREWQDGRGNVPQRAVVLTFDDGYASHFELVAPLLVRYRFGGTFFVTVDDVGRPGYVTWDQVRKLAFLGMEIGSHGASHRPLTSLSADELDQELAGSKQRIEQELGRPVPAIAAPGGFWDRAVAAAVKRAGYEAAWVSTIGTNGADTHPLGLRRVVVRHPVAVDRIVSMVEGWGPSFWWASNQQLMIRLLKKILGVYWYEQLKRRLAPNA